jgi:hypothetical protein
MWKKSKLLPQKKPSFSSFRENTLVIGSSSLVTLLKRESFKNGDYLPADRFAVAPLLLDRSHGK